MSLKATATTRRERDVYINMSSMFVKMTEEDVVDKGPCIQLYIYMDETIF